MIVSISADCNESLAEMESANLTKTDYQEEQCEDEMNDEEALGGPNKLLQVSVRP